MDDGSYWISCRIRRFILAPLGHSMPSSSQFPRDPSQFQFDHREVFNTEASGWWPHYRNRKQLNGIWQDPIESDRTRTAGKVREISSNQKMTELSSWSLHCARVSSYYAIINGAVMWETAGASQLAYLQPNGNFNAPNSIARKTNNYIHPMLSGEETKIVERTFHRHSRACAI